MGVESLGVPVPGETTLVVGAVLAAQGHLSLWLVALVAWCGAVLGDNTGYLVGRRWGRRLVAAPVLRRIYDPRRIAVADRLFARYGVLAVFFGRFVAILRILAGPLAGMHRVPWRSFLIANACGGAVWVGTVSVVGWVLGSNLDRAESIVGRSGYGGLGLVVLILAVAAVWSLRRQRREMERAEDSAPGHREASAGSGVGSGDMASPAPADPDEAS